MRKFYKIFILTVVAIGVFNTEAASAQMMGGMLDYYGGSIQSVTYCTCSASILLYVWDLTTKSMVQILYTPGISSLRSYYNIFIPGPNVIGGMTLGGGVCEVVTGDTCTQQGNPQGIIDFLRGIGTSLIGVTP